MAFPDLLTVFKSVFRVGEKDESCVVAKSGAWTELRNATDGLAQRQALLLKGCKWAAMGISVLLVVAVGCGVVANFSNPSTGITSVDVPNHLQKVFQAKLDPTTQAGSSPGIINISDAVGSASDLIEDMFGILRYMAIVMVILGGLMALLRGSFTPLFMAVALFAMTNVVPTLVEAIEPGNSNSSKVARPKIGKVGDLPEDFGAAHYSTMVQVLKIMPGVSAEERDYVLAQAAIRDEVDAPFELAQAALAIRKGKGTFEPSAQAAYAIEMKSFGNVTSRPALFLKEISDKRKAVYGGYAESIGVVGMVGLFLVGGIAGVALYIRRRVHRINHLLEMLA